MPRNPLSWWSILVRRLNLAQICDMIEALKTNGRIRLHTG